MSLVVLGWVDPHPKQTFLIAGWLKPGRAGELQSALLVAVNTISAGLKETKNLS